MSKLFTTILPSLLAGGLLFGSSLTGAQPAPPTPPTPPTAATPPRPPRPPRVPAPAPAPAPHAKAQVKIDLDVDGLVDKQIDEALQAIGSDPHIPPHVRQAIRQRLDKVRTKIKVRLSRVDRQDLEALSEQLGELGDEIGDEMEAFGKDMEKWGKQYEKDMEKWGKHFEKDMEKWGKQVEKQAEKQIKLKGKLHGQGPVIIQVDPHDDMGDIDAITDLDDHGDLDDAMRSLGAVKLAPDQRAKLRRLRADSDQRVARAKEALDRASESLRTQLENTSASDVEIERAIDNVTRAEAEIRKARILAWVNARRLLDDTQRRRIEAVTRGRTR